MPENFVFSYFSEASCLPFFLIGTWTELLDPVKMRLSDSPELQLEPLLTNKEDQDHTSFSCIDCTLGKIVVKACSSSSADKENLIMHSLGCWGFFPERNTFCKVLFLLKCFLILVLILGLVVTFSTV